MPASAVTVYTELANSILDHLEAGRLQTALAASDAALAVCPEHERVILLCMKCNALVMLGRPFEALQIATEGRDLAMAQTQPLLVAEAGLSLTFALQGLEEHSRAIDIAAECEHIAREQADDELLARSLRTLGISYSVLGRHEQALALLSSVLPMLEAHARTPERLLHARYSLITAQSRAMTAQGNLAAGSESDSDGAERQRRHYRELYEQWQRFVRDVSERQLTRLRAMALGNAGIAARYAGDLDVALATLGDTLRLQSELGMRGHCAVTGCHYGAVLNSLGRADEAVAAFQQAIALLQDGNPRELAGAWEELAAIHEARGDVQAAFDALKQARATEKRLHDNAGLVAAARLEQKAEIERLARQWTRLATEDSLTGLGNRRAFDRQLLAMADASRSGTQFALALFDLDHFKQVNDRFGHAMGDAVLKRFAALLLSGCRAEDLAARIGGEEFAWLLASDTEAGALAAVERVVEAVRAEQWSTLAPGLRITASVGLVASRERSVEERRPERLLADADRRLYRAKGDGRDRIVSAD